MYIYIYIYIYIYRNTVWTQFVKTWSGNVISCHNFINVISTSNEIATRALWQVPTSFLQRQSRHILWNRHKNNYVKFTYMCTSTIIHTTSTYT